MERVSAARRLNHRNGTQRFGDGTNYCTLVGAWQLYLQQGDEINNMDPTGWKMELTIVN